MRLLFLISYFSFLLFGGQHQVYANKYRSAIHQSWASAKTHQVRTSADVGCSFDIESDTDTEDSLSSDDHSANVHPYVLPADLFRYRIGLLFQFIFSPEAANPLVRQDLSGIASNREIYLEVRSIRI